MEGIDRRLAPHIDMLRNDTTPDAPHISLEINASERLSKTLPFQIEFTLKRAEDGHSSSCIFLWSPNIHGFGATGFILLHRTADSIVERVEINHTGLLKLPEEVAPLVVGFGNHFLWELAPGREITFVVTLPERYQKVLVPEEKYQLVWPGSEIDQRDWGTIHEHANQELRPRSTNDNPQKPTLTLPGGPSISFQAEEGSDPWPMRAMREVKIGFMAANLEEQRWRLRQQKKQREYQGRPASPQPIQASERIPEAPILSVTLKCPPTVPRRGIIDVEVKVTYEATGYDRDKPARPIIFHTYPFKVSDGPREGFRLYRHSGGDSWEKYEDPEESQSGYIIADDPDVAVSVGQHEDFVSLRLGESWSMQRRLQGEAWTTLPGDTDVGDVFQYRFRGAFVDWWDWGSREEHANTVVKLPCWIAGQVVDPADNGKRPKLVVPASEAVVEFSII